MDKTVAIMGGTFNPIHYGHLVAAETVREEINADEVVFMPSGNPPHKNTKNVADCESRYIMTLLATATNPKFSVSRMEIDRKGTTYTVDTVKQLKEMYPSGTKLYFITGADAIEQILTWHCPEELLKICTFVAVSRPGFDKSSLKGIIDNLSVKYKAKIIFIDIPSLEISSTDIRGRILSGRSIKYLVPTNVENYIIKSRIYGNQDLYKEITEQLREILKPERFVHTLGVASEAARLAAVYGADEQSAYLAGLLHDCAKNYSDEQKVKLCEKYKIKIDEVLSKQIDLAHSFIGAKLAKNKYGIKDKDVLNAIKYHTTGRADMSLLEKIIYIADCIEPNRKYYDGLEKLRANAYKNLDKAVYSALKSTLEYNKKKGRLIHPLSIEAFEFLKKTEVKK